MSINEKNQLKVRAYIKSQKRMIENVCSFEYLHHFSANDYKFIKIRFVDNNYETKFDNLGCYIPDEIILPIGDVIIMQCTGLKDKNTKLIFEGDITREYFGETGTYQVMFCSLVARFEFVNLDDEDYDWQMYSQPFEGMGEHQGVSTDLKIIGNIYENPELLEVQA